MDIQSIIEKLLPIMPIAFIVAACIVGLSYVTYTLYRKRDGSKKASALQFSALFLLLSWFTIVMILTTFSRGAHFEGWINFQLFSDYMNAWHQWSLSELQLIIFNMLMFLPLGFLLPLLGTKYRRFMPVLLISLVVTMSVELIQMFTRRGIFELNDILHNTIGSIAGYFVIRAIQEQLEHRKLKVQSLLKAFGIPLFFTVFFFVAIIVYDTKELGNLSIRPVTTQNMEQVDIVLNTKLNKESSVVSLYYSEQLHNKDYGESQVELLKSTFQYSQKGGVRTEGYNRMWFLLDESNNEFMFNYNLKDGTWSVDPLNYDLVPTVVENLNKYRAFYENWLITNRLMPEEAIYSTQDSNTIRWERQQSVQQIAFEENDFFEGFIMLIPSHNINEPINIFYTMKENVFVRKVNIISPAKAYEEVLDGNFYMYNDLTEGDKLIVDGYELDYIYDSKGYYQPVYIFSGKVNDDYWEAAIPAISS